MGGPSPLMIRWGVLKKYAQVLSGLVGATSSAVLAFTNLGHLPLDARLVLVGATALIAVVVLCLLVSSPLKLRTRPGALGIALRCFVLLLVCWMAAKALQVTATYHSARIFQRVRSQYSNVGSIEIQPPRFPVQLTINVWVPQTGGVKIEKFFPASWNRQDPANWQERNRTNHQDTLLLTGFKTPQVFGIWYQLSASADALNWEAFPTPDNVRVLTEDELRRYHKWSYIYGGALWLIGVCFWFLRWFW
jgi:hypothetical protein